MIDDNDDRQVCSRRINISVENQWRTVVEQCRLAVGRVNVGLCCVPLNDTVDLNARSVDQEANILIVVFARAVSLDQMRLVSSAGRDSVDLGGERLKVGQVEDFSAADDVWLVASRREWRARLSGVASWRC